MSDGTRFRQVPLFPDYRPMSVEAPVELFHELGQKAQEREDENAKLYSELSALASSVQAAPGHEEYRDSVVQPYMEEIQGLSQMDYGSRDFRRGVYDLAARFGADRDVQNIVTSKKIYDDNWAKVLNDPNMQGSIYTMDPSVMDRSGNILQNRQSYGNLSYVPPADYETPIIKQLQQVEAELAFQIGQQQGVTVKPVNGIWFWYDDKLKKEGRVRDLDTFQASIDAITDNIMAGQIPYQRYMKGVFYDDRAQVRNAVQNLAIPMMYNQPGYYERNNNVVPGQFSGDGSAPLGPNGGALPMIIDPDTNKMVNPYVAAMDNVFSGITTTLDKVNALRSGAADPQLPWASRYEQSIQDQTINWDNATRELAMETERELIKNILTLPDERQLELLTMLESAPQGLTLEEKLLHVRDNMKSQPDAYYVTTNFHSYSAADQPYAAKVKDQLESQLDNRYAISAEFPNVGLQSASTILTDKNFFGIKQDHIDDYMRVAGRVSANNYAIDMLDDLDDRLLFVDAHVITVPDRNNKMHNVIVSNDLSEPLIEKAVSIPHTENGVQGTINFEMKQGYWGLMVAEVMKTDRHGGNKVMMRINDLLGRQGVSLVDQGVTTVKKDIVNGELLYVAEIGKGTTYSGNIPTELRGVYDKFQTNYGNTTTLSGTTPEELAYLIYNYYGVLKKP